MVTVTIISVFIVMMIGIIAIIKMPESKTSERKPIQPSKPKKSIANNKKDSLFIEDYSLLEFARKYGPKMQVGEHTKDCKIYHDCKFTDNDGKETRVYFFSQLGELTPEEIKNRKEELFIGKMKNGKYYIHDSNVKPWEDVNLD